MNHKILEILNQVEDENLRNRLLAMQDSLSNAIKFFPAGKKNHHSQVGGYGVHIAEVMMFGIELYDMVSKKHTLDFTKDDVILVAYGHDLSKLWMYEPQTDEWRKKKLKEMWKVRGDVHGYDDSAKATQVFAQYGILLQDKHLEAISLHHGGWSEGLSSVYSMPKHFGYLTTILHCADLLSGFILGKPEW